MARSANEDASRAVKAAINDLAKLRGAAMRLVAQLAPPVKSRAKKVAAEKDTAPATPLVAPPAAPLLGKSDGVIDGFTILAQIVVRIIEQERRCFDAAAAPVQAAPQVDEQALGHRITAELDRLAARQSAAGVGAPDFSHRR